MNFRYKIMQFMNGRYGTDSLTYFILGVAVVVSFVGCFVYSYLMRTFTSALCIYALFRTFSKNTYARSRENERFLYALNKFRKYRDTRRQRSADITHIYKKCPYCRAVLRLPRRKGKHTTVCPKCLKSFKVRVWHE